MNRKIGMIGSAVNLFGVVGFALAMMLGSLNASYVASIFIALGFVPMICAFGVFGEKETKVAGQAAGIFAAMYALIILLVYFAQLTSVRLDNLSVQADQVLNYQRFGLFFNYDLLGYGLMAVSTFFAGLTLHARTKADKWLKALLLIHGVFAVSCFILPVLGLFSADMKGSEWIGTVILEFWCAYFTPVAVLAFLHFLGKKAEA